MDVTAAGLTLFLGAWSTLSGSAHLYGVLVTASRKSYAYDLRLAALRLVGMLIVFGGLLCISAVRGLAHGERRAWDRAAIGSLLLGFVCVLVYPMQNELAGSLGLLAGPNLIILLASPFAPLRGA